MGMNRSVAITTAFLMRLQNKDCKSVVSEVSRCRKLGILSNKSFLYSLLTLRDENGARPGAPGAYVVVGLDPPAGALSASPQNPCIQGCSVGFNSILNLLYQVCPIGVTESLSPNPWRSS